MNGIKATCTSKFKGWFPYFDSRLLAIGVLVGLAYYFAAQIGFALTFPPHRVSLMWIPNSVLLAAFLLLPVRTWWFLLATAFGAHLAVELRSGVPLSMALCWFVSNSCEAVLGAVLTRLLIRGPVSFGTFRNITIFFVCGVLVASFLSSFLNATCVVLNRWGTEGYWQTWRMVFFSNVFSSMTVVPAVVAWRGAKPTGSRKLSVLRVAEIYGLITALLTTSFAVFYYFEAGPAVTPVFLYAPLPFLLWAAVRFGIRGAATAILGVALLAIWAGAHNHGPFLTSSPDQNALSIQSFFIVLCATLDPLAASLSERRAAIVALRVNQERYRELVESQTDLVCRYLADSTLTFVNEAYCKFFGRQRQDLIGRKFLELVPSVAHQKMLLGIASLMVHRQRITGEREVLLPDGTIGWHQWVDYPIESQDGRIHELQGIGRDITARKRMETALRETEERNRAILDAMPDLMFLLNQSGVCLDYQAQDERHLPVAPKQFLGRNIREILPADVAEQILRALRLVLKTGEMKLLEYTLHVRGKDRNYEARMVRSGADKILSVVRDITDRKHAEEARQNLTHTLRLAVVGELTAVIAHEVNQPLNAILNNAEAAQALLHVNDIPVDELRNILADIRNDDLRASEAIRRIRKLSQKHTVSMERLEAGPLIENVVRLVTADALRRRVNLQTRVSASLPVIRGDAVHLQQVLLNLIINAMDAMDNLPETDRVLTIRAERAADNHLLLSVSDTGHGVPIAILPRIFESFFSTKKDGVGLGLSIARSIIEAHNGRLWCENNASGGATFRIALPPENANPPT